MIQILKKEENKKIAFISGWYNFNNNYGMSDDYKFMTQCLYETAKKYFLPNHDVEFIFMNNSNIKIDGVTNINFDYKLDSFWHMCLMKILSLEYLKKDYDFIFVNDNDQIYMKEVTDEDLLLTDFIFLDHWFKPTVEKIHKEVTDVVELNFNTKNEFWTMGNFFGGKQKNMDELLKITKENHEKFFLNKTYENFYSRYPEEIFTIKYVFENNINHKRLNCLINPLNSNEEFFLGDFSHDESDHNKIKNTKLMHDTKKNLTKLKNIFNQK